MVKMYCIVARESLLKMNGNRGKLAAQTGHAYLHAYWDSQDRFDFRYRWSNDGKPILADYEEYRRSGKAVKICLIVETVADLQVLHDAYKPICGVSLVTDAGLTCFDGPTTTCLGIGPIRDEDIGKDLRALNVLI